MKQIEITMSDNRLKIGITQGDTNGVGWEVILRTFADQRVTELFTPVIYGSQKAAEAYTYNLPPGGQQN